MSKNKIPPYWYTTIAPVIYDNELPHAARTLFCVLRGLTKECGYCFATNSYLAGLFKWSDTYVSTLITVLQNRGHIECRSGVYKGFPQREIISTHTATHTSEDEEGYNERCRGGTTNVVGGVQRTVYPIYKEERIINKRIVENNPSADPNGSAKASLSQTNEPSVKLPKVYFKKRYEKESLPFQLGEALIDMMIKRGNNTHRRYLTSDEGRYLLIQNQAHAFDLLLNKDRRDVEEVIEVLQWSQESTFWKGNILSGDKFRTQYNELRKQMWDGGFGSSAADPTPELTQRMIGAYRALIGSAKYVPSPVQHRKFIEGAAKAMAFFPLHEIDQSEWTDHIIMCLEKAYTSKSQSIYPGHFNSSHTWDILMPQYLQDAGLSIWEEDDN